MLFLDNVNSPNTREMYKKGWIKIMIHRHRPKEIVNSPGQLADDQVYSPSLLAEIKCNSPRLLPLCRGGASVRIHY